jgi:hypothetical protein
MRPWERRNGYFKVAASYGGSAPSEAPTSRCLQSAGVNTLRRTTYPEGYGTPQRFEAYTPPGFR